MYLTLPEYKKLKLNTLVLIDNTVFLIMSITDFNIMEEGLTKVELLKVNDINNYLRGQNIVVENLTASTLYVDFATGQLVESSRDYDQIRFIVPSTDLVAFTAQPLLNTTLEIKEGSVIKTE